MAESTPFNLSGIQLEARHPYDVNAIVWPILQRNARAAFSDSLLGESNHSDLSTVIETSHQRSQTEIDHFVKLHDTARYRDTRRNPQLLVGNEFADNQSFSRPSLITAQAEGRIVGHLYVADNVSGETEKIQAKKRLLRTRNYRFIREAVVIPEFQHRGIVLAMAHLALKGAQIGQPFSAYAWPLENNEVSGLLSLPGITRTNMGPVQPFGPPEISAPAEQHRYQHRSARRLGRQIAALPGFKAALKDIRPPRVWNGAASK